MTAIRKPSRRSGSMNRPRTVPQRTQSFSTVRLARSPPIRRVELSLARQAANHLAVHDALAANARDDLGASAADRSRQPTWIRLSKISRTRPNVPRMPTSRPPSSTGAR
jgi:hypothetical protein